MPARLRLYDLRLSRLPSLVGKCQSDVPEIADYVNTAQRRLLYAKEAGDEGWWGTWAEIVFNVSRSKPYITLPRSVARIELAALCDRPVPVQNQFYEYLSFGNGRLPKQFITCENLITQGYTRNNSATFVDLSSAPQKIRVYATNAADYTRRVFIQGVDNNGETVYSIDGLNRVQGVFVVMDSPFVDTVTQFNQITGIQKDATVGQVQIFQVDPSTGEEVLLLTMEPSEETAWYRRYYFDNLPNNCCYSGSEQTLQITAIAKLELIPVICDTDYTLLQNMEAIIEECQSIRLSEVDSTVAKQQAQERHLQAIRLLNGELGHYLGIDSPAVDFRPFGSARLEHKRIGSIL